MRKTWLLSLLALLLIVFVAPRLGVCSVGDAQRWGVRFAGCGQTPDIYEDIIVFRTSEHALGEDLNADGHPYSYLDIPIPATATKATTDSWAATHGGNTWVTSREFAVESP